MNMERKIACELVRIAKFLLGYVQTGSQVTNTEVAKRFFELQRSPLPMPERATLFNQIDEIASRGRDTGNLTRTRAFRGWGREDFIKLNRRLRYLRSTARG